jgi:phosphatidylethanolamine-binding protein (PEBP) family uncharacterized protein
MAVLSSPALANGEEIPSRYTNDGVNVSPPLEKSGAPVETLSFALVMEDLDAPVRPARHWSLYDIAPRAALEPL